MAIFFTSDQHFDHKNVIKYCNRPYTTVEEMNEDIISKYNAMIGPNDICYHLGDVSLSFKTVERILPRLNGIKHLRMGNHDYCHPAHSKGKRQPEKWKQAYIDVGFNTVELGECLTLDNIYVILSHMPYRNLEPGAHGEKYADFRLINQGQWLLHGHVHEKWLKRGKMINVGVDQHGFAPVELQTIFKLIKEDV